MTLQFDPSVPGGADQKRNEAPDGVVRLWPDRPVFLKSEDIPREGIAGRVPVETVTGLRAAETLRPGDVLRTASGEAELIFVWHEKISASETARYATRRPVRIAAGALGQGQPEADITVGPEHLVEFATSGVEALFGRQRAKAEARDLVGLPGIDLAEDADLTLVHLVFDAAEAPMAAGLGLASATLTPARIAALPDDVREGLLFELPKLGMTAGFAGFEPQGLVLDAHEAAIAAEGVSTFEGGEAMLEPSCSLVTTDAPVLSALPARSGTAQVSQISS